MTKRVRIGVIGAGSNTRERHLPGFRAIDGVELTTVVNRSEASSRKVAEAFGIRKIATHWREVVADPEVDAVCIGTWPYLHAEASIAALKAGKHVLTEARMAMDLAEARAMAAAAAARPELVAQIVPAPFSLDFDATVQELVEAGRLGELRFAEVESLTGNYAEPELPFTWRQDVHKSGKNMLTLGICHEMLERWLPAGISVAEVCARGAVGTPERFDPESGTTRMVELPEMIVVTGRLSNGGTLVEHYSGLHAGEARLNIILGGRLATLRADLLAGRLWLAESGGEPHELTVPEAARRGWRVEADFIDSIRTGSPVRLTSFVDGVRYMAFTDAVHTAWQSGETVLTEN